MMMRIQILTIVLALGCTAAFSDSKARIAVTPIQAELVADMEARLLKVGATVFALVSVDWQGTDCFLRNGAILEGHVVAVVPHTKTAKGSEVDLAFTKAQCMSKEMGGFELVLVALAAPPQNDDLGIISATTPFNTPGGFASIDNLRASYVAPIYNSAFFGQKPVVPHLQVGEVSGIRGLKLSVGSGPDKSTALTSKDHDVSLDRHSLLLLVPLKGTFPTLSANSETGLPPSAGVPAPDVSTDRKLEALIPAQPPVADIDLCAPPQCNQQLPSGNEGELGDIAASISIHQFGYAPRPQRVMNSFDYDDALAYLAPKELLVAFNPHTLLSRHNLGPAGSTERVIRAVLVDTDTRRVTRTVEWEIPDNGQYLWPLSEGLVLVHVGSELRVYGEGLKIQNRVPIDGPLAFVRETPNGAFVAIGVIRERHSPELHAQLSQSLGGNPEEDVDIRILNHNFETIATSSTRSDLMVPTLLNEGQARLLAQPKMHYRISMMTWDNLASTVAQFNSSCVPELSSIAPDLIFMVSCNKQNEELEYRVLHTNGTPVLKGISNWNEFGYAAGGSANHDVFVVKTVQSSRPVPSKASFSAADLFSEELGVYRAGDGKRLLKVLAGSPSSSRDGFALAPDGSQLAVLTRDQITLYSVPRK
jgi:hypothetical protein